MIFCDSGLFGWYWIEDTHIIDLKLTEYSRLKLSGWLVCDLGSLELNDSRGQFGRLYRQVYRKESKQESMQVSKLVCK